MCRNIKPLYNFKPATTKDEIVAAATQYVRKISGFKQPSRVNQTVCDEAIEAVSQATANLINRLHTNSPPRDKLEYEQKAKLRSRLRFSDKYK